LQGGGRAGPWRGRRRRPASAVRSGPWAPPSLSKRWQTKHFASANSARPRSKLRPFIPFSTIGVSSFVVHFLTKGRGLATTSGGTSLPSSSPFSATFSAGVSVATASVLVLLTKPRKLCPPRNFSARWNHEKYVLRVSGVHPFFRVRRPKT